MEPGTLLMGQLGRDCAGNEVLLGLQLTNQDMKPGMSWKPEMLDNAETGLTGMPCPTRKVESSLLKLLQLWWKRS